MIDLELDRALVRRLRDLTKTTRMWGSPEELEAVALHFSHVLLSARTPGWSFEQTFAWWQARGLPFAADADEHAAMRSKMYGADEARARAQVVQGFVVVWAGLERQPSREAVFTPWLETLLDHPERAGTPDRLNMVLFTLMGFVAANPQAYVLALNTERHRIGGHELRPFPVVAPPGPTDAGVTWTRHFSSWQAVSDAITAAAAALER